MITIEEAIANAKASDSLHRNCLVTVNRLESENEELRTRLSELESSQPITFVMHPDDPNIKLLRDGTYIILQRKLPAYE